MARINLFADESGNFDCTRKIGASRYFILTTIACDTYAVGDALLALRRDMAWDGLGLDSDYHATTDTQAVRDRVFRVLQAHDFRIDTTILEKAKAEPSTRASDEGFYRLAWYLHMRRVAPLVVRPEDELLVVGASLGTRRRRAAMHGAVRAVVSQVSPTLDFRIASWNAQSDPCLQVADYCCRAVSRKWGRGDTRSYDLIRDKIKSEQEVWEPGEVLYY